MSYVISSRKDRVTSRGMLTLVDSHPLLIHHSHTVTHYCHHCHPLLSPTTVTTARYADFEPKVVELMRPEKQEFEIRIAVYCLEELNHQAFHIGSDTQDLYMEFKIGGAVPMRPKGGSHTLPHSSYHTAVIRYHTAVIRYYTAVIRYHTAVIQYHTAVMHYHTAVIHYHTAVIH
jgi:hypothetical protein